ncbi:AAA family ATPase [Myceligenerans crystallogenes]|uniref:AAA family ATPase n=1 Tax=Myceligenerans crystallogenes TaxID=316335 RepID=A0ABN2NKF3_9MICO
MTGIGSELNHEQAVVDVLYARLDELRAATRARLRDVRLQGAVGTHQNRSERDAFATLYEDRAAQLDAVEERLVFGRLDLTGGEVRYVGRIGLNDAEHRGILTDWRAPAAEAFYRATALHPADVRRRRHLVTKARAVTGLEDEVLDLDSGIEASSLSGEGALLASMATGRTGRMTDIVATIQAEQDRIIRSELTGALVVQGGPGTGKTAVALHRAAYLLYAHRRMLERSGVLLVGPNRSFLRYIDQVLPSLGETGVVATTIAELIPGVEATGLDAPDVARVKGRPLWRRVIRRAVRARERVPAADTQVRIDGQDFVIRRRDVEGAIGRARRSHKPHNEARTTFVKDMLGRIADQATSFDGTRLAAEERAALIEDLRSDRDVRVALNLAWFPITPQKLLEDLYAKPHRLAEAAPELSLAERDLLRRAPGGAWTEADVPLLDEAYELLGEDDSLARAEAAMAARERSEALEHARSVLSSGSTASTMIQVDAETLADRFATSGPSLTTAERAAADRAWTFGHVVVDEAQELSPMAWRALVRRVPTRSMTIVGDVAQTSSAAGARDWGEMLTPLLRESWRLAELTVSYRTPATVADTAQRVARAGGLPVSELTAARDVTGAMAFVRVRADDGAGALPAEVAHEAAALAKEYVEADAGRVAVLAAAPRTRELAGAVTAALRSALGEDEAERIAAQQPEDRQVTVLDPRETKGLEFDAVVLVEPAEIALGPGGLSDLYVAMTRPTQRLVVVHGRELPAGFEE